MSICVFNVQLHRKKKSGALSGLVFVILSIVAYVKAIKPGVFTFILGLIACYSVIILVADNADNETAFGKVMEVLSKYTMPIFLMHTIMAAALRAALLRIGVTNCVINNGLSEASKEQLKHKTGEEIVDADIAQQMEK